MQNWLEFQAVVMAAGKGSRIPEMTATKPKCLLPVGNKPMIYYPLKLLENAGFKGKLSNLFFLTFRYRYKPSGVVIVASVFLFVVLETKIIVADNYASDVQEEVDRLGLEMDLTLVIIPSDEDWGTADSLRYISDCILVGKIYLEIVA